MPAFRTLGELMPQPCRSTWRAAACAGLALLLAGGARAGALAVDGFSPGMSRAEASVIRPEARWKEEPTGDSRHVTQKVFASSRFGRAATVGVNLDPGGSFVRSINVNFETESDIACIEGAAAVLKDLDSEYGRPSEAREEMPSIWARWNLGAGQSVKWVEICAVGARRFYVSYFIEDAGR